MGFIDCGDPGDTLHEPCAACSPRYPERMRPQPLLRDVAYENEGAPWFEQYRNDARFRTCIDTLDRVEGGHGASSLLGILSSLCTELATRDKADFARRMAEPAPRYIALPATDAPKVLEGHSR